jgi:hypothetical protein
MDQISACGNGVGLGVGVVVGSGVIVGATVGITVGVLVDFGLGVLVTGSGVAVTTMMTCLGVAVDPQDVSAIISRTTTPVSIAEVTISGIDLFSNKFFMPFPSLWAEVPAILYSSLLLYEKKITNQLKLV